VRILLPPSETKLKGGAPHSGRFTLSFPVQDPSRLDILVPLEILCRDDPAEAARTLKLGPKSLEELTNNRFTDAPVMPAIDRYTGVLYSATGVADWTLSQRSWAATHVFIHSALFGIISSDDSIPAYRLSHDTRLSGLPLKDFWLDSLGSAITEMAAGDWVLDARSVGYRDLAPIPPGTPSLYLDVVSAHGGKALNHFNKIHKGELVAALVRDMPADGGPDKFMMWCSEAGMDVSFDDSRIVLTV
jgi:cytoplasmic iron level regulating protein YaaA (DUF328/UPF0246 family)